MVTISDAASREISKVLQSDQGQGKELYLNFVGYG
jgi:hypothetical protein